MAYRTIRGLKKQLKEHKKWLACQGGKRLKLAGRETLEARQSRFARH